jgi:integrase
VATIRKLPTRKTKPWRVEIRKAGKAPISETFKTKKEAQAFAAKIEGDFDRWARLLGGELRRHTLGDLIDKFMDVYKGKDPSVVSRAAWWRDQYGDRPLSEFTADTVRDGLALLEDGTAQHGGKQVTGTDRARSPATINRYRTAVSTVFKLAIDRRWYGIQDNPAGGIRQRTENNSRFGRCLEDSERSLLLEACDASPWAELGLFVRLALATGARRGELLKLEWGDVDLKRGTVLFRDTKNNDDRRVPLIGEARKLLTAQSKVRKLKQPHVFAHPHKDDVRPPVDWYWQQARKAAGVENLRLHDLRHSCGSYLARNGASAFQIAAILGHRSGPGLTARYVHLAAEDSRDLLESALAGVLGGGHDG